MKQKYLQQILFNIVLLHKHSLIKSFIRIYNRILLSLPKQVLEIQGRGLGGRRPPKQPFPPGEVACGAGRGAAIAGPRLAGILQAQPPLFPPWPGCVAPRREGPARPAGTVPARQPVPPGRRRRRGIPRFACSRPFSGDTRVPAGQREGRPTRRPPARHLRRAREARPSCLSAISCTGPGKGGRLPARPPALPALRAEAMSARPLRAPAAPLWVASGRAAGKGRGRSGGGSSGDASQSVGCGEPEPRSY